MVKISCENCNKEYTIDNSLYDKFRALRKEFEEKTNLYGINLNLLKVVQEALKLENKQCCDKMCLSFKKKPKQKMLTIEDLKKGFKKMGGVNDKVIIHCTDEMRELVLAEEEHAKLQQKKNKMGNPKAIVEIWNIVLKKQNYKCIKCGKDIDKNNSSKHSKSFDLCCTECYDKGKSIIYYEELSILNEKDLNKII